MTKHNVSLLILAVGIIALTALLYGRQIVVEAKRIGGYPEAAQMAPEIYGEPPTQPDHLAAQELEPVAEPEPAPVKRPWPDGGFKTGSKPGEGELP